jgi:RNA polymerase sigma-70 factor (ECF subfamily)
MTEAKAACCDLAADRLPNDALVALMADAIRHGAPPCARILEEATSFFTAFYRGQVLAARVSDAELAHLVSAAVAALHRRCVTFDRQIPFRAWLMDIARLTMIEYQREKTSTTDDAETVAAAPGPGSSRDGSSRIRNHELYPAPVF